MNEELQNQLTSMISKLQDVGVEAFMFGKEQIPDVISQLLTFHLVEALVMSVIYFLVGFVLPVIVGKMFWAYYRKALAEYKAKERRHPKDDPDGLGFWFIPIGLLFLFLFGFVGNLTLALKIWLAPKVYVLEYLATLGKEVI